MEKQSSTSKIISLEELKILQMDVLQAIDEFCTEHNIRYSMACGTLLGAIRHKGYIPWDDDIDIYVPRDDYQKLISIYPDSIRSHYKLASIERNKNWELPYAKVYDDRTIMKENASLKIRIGVNIDIFPVDDVPSGKEWEKFDKIRRRLIIFYSLMTVRVNRSRTWSKNLVIVFSKIVGLFLPPRFWAKRINILSQRNNGKGYKDMFECCQGLLQKKPFPKSLFNNIIYIPFEDRRFKAFEKSDIYLKNGFGDYMKLPPEEKRVSHHGFHAYWK